MAHENTTDPYRMSWVGKTTLLLGMTLFCMALTPPDVAFSNPADLQEPTQDLPRRDRVRETSGAGTRAVPDQALPNSAPVKPKRNPSRGLDEGSTYPVQPEAIPAPPASPTPQTSPTPQADLLSEPCGSPAP